MNRTAKALAAGAVIGLAALAAPASGHHSFAMYNHEGQIKLTGNVTHFQWTNPHVYIELAAPGPNGAVRRWTIECANPGILNRLGWKWNMIKEGDKLTTIIAPLRNGDPAGLLKQVTLSDGRKFGNGAPAGPPLID